MTENDLFRLAEHHYETLKRSESFLGNPEFITFHLQIPCHRVNAIITIENSQVKKIEVTYESGNKQTFLAKKQAITNREASVNP